MPAIMADHHVEGHLARLIDIWTSPDWFDLWDGVGCELQSFERLGLATNASDCELWNACQEVQEEIRKIGPPDVAQIELISTPELHEILRIGLHEKHEFDDLVPVIYQEATGKAFECIDADDKLLGREEWSILKDICGDDEEFLQLQMQLLDVERKYRSMSRSRT